ncbi:UNVERIFIED_CONTAM: hypothetical protein K2H54_038476 [Gekko kuhli]
MPRALFGGLFCLSLYLLESAAFNLDVTETILKYGDNGSFFGFSVALHQQLSPQPVSWGDASFRGKWEAGCQKSQVLRISASHCDGFANAFGSLGW